MKLNFRQGVVQHQTDSNKNQLFLQANGQTVNLYVSPTPTIVSFAHKEANYLYTEGLTVLSAWTGPFVPGTDYWLYWDLHPITGLRTFGHTTRAPIVSAIKPGSAATGQHWFDLKENTMKEWNGFVWKPVIRVFAAKYASGSSFVTMAQGATFVGSQVGLRTLNNSGSLIFDGLGKPVKTSTGSFFTSETGASVAGLSSAVKYAAIQVEAEVQEPIPGYSFVYFSDFNEISLASPSTSATKPVGMIEVDSVQGMLAHVVTGGVVTNTKWNFTEVNDRIYIGENGQLATAPVFPGQPSVGYVIAPTAILVREAAVATGSGAGVPGEQGPEGPQGPPGQDAGGGFIPMLHYMEYAYAGNDITFDADPVGHSPTLFDQYLSSSTYFGEGDHPAGRMAMVPSGGEGSEMANRFIPGISGLYLFEITMVMVLSENGVLPMHVGIRGDYESYEQHLFISPPNPLGTGESSVFTRSVTFMGSVQFGAKYQVYMDNRSSGTSARPVSGGSGSTFRAVLIAPMLLA